MWFRPERPYTNCYASEREVFVGQRGPLTHSELASTLSALALALWWTTGGAMSLTGAAEVFVSIHEDALNDLISAVATDRPRLLVYGSPAFVPITTVSETRMDAIPFPGVSGGIEWRISFETPHIDLFDQDDPLPPELTLSPGQFSVRLGVELCLDCRRIKIDPRPQGGDGKPDDQKGGKDRHPLREVTCCKLQVFAVGHLLRVSTASGEDAITFEVDGVEIVDITPDDVESVLECLIFMILQAVLATFRIPLRALRVGAFNLAVTEGPLIEDDQVKARGTF